MLCVKINYFINSKINLFNPLNDVFAQSLKKKKSLEKWGINFAVNVEFWDDFMEAIVP